MLDFDDPTTWDQPLSDTTALSMGIWAINTLMHPDASSDAQFTALDFFGEGCTNHLAALRERLANQAAQLPQFVVDQDRDRNLDDYLLHEVCGEEACTIEHGDSLETLVATALGHIADGQCPGEKTEDEEQD